MAENKKRSIHDLIKEHSIDKVLDTETIYEIELDKISRNEEQPRKYFDEESLNELALSIKEHGVFQPIILKTDLDGYIIVSGERRFRAAKIAGLKKIPAVIRNYSKGKVAEISLVENIQRENLSPIEEAKAYSIIINEMNLTQNDLAKRIGKSRSYVTNILGLLKLPDEVKEMLLNKKITMGHARAISKLDDPKQMIDLANEIINKNLNVRETEDLTSNEKKRNEIKKTNYNKMYKVERDMISKYYNSKISINNNKITFKVENEEEIKKLVEQLMKNAL